MDASTIYELVGYVGSVLVATALAMSSILKLRLINMAGAAFLTTYGLLIEAYPVAVLNGFIVAINGFHIRRMLGKSEYFTLLVVQPSSEYLKHFLRFYADEISAFLPEFVYRPSAETVVFFVLRDLVPAGVFIAEPLDHDAVSVQLDFVAPGYRDYRVGRFIFGAEFDLFTKRKIRRIYSPPGTEKHRQYLDRMGFVREPGDGRYVFELAGAH